MQEYWESGQNLNLQETNVPALTQVLTLPETLHETVESQPTDPPTANNEAAPTSAT